MSNHGAYSALDLTPREISVFPVDNRIADNLDLTIRRRLRPYNVGGGKEIALREWLGYRQNFR
jgi:hypothetical protein